MVALIASIVLIEMQAGKLRIASQYYWYCRAGHQFYTIITQSAVGLHHR
ncbi:MAG: hypothetical protein JNM14_05615 [Ferruginibacter sp.]|nr:hypothetical protein [Ferruginibacter sp.]